MKKANKLKFEMKTNNIKLKLIQNVNKYYNSM